MSVRVGVLGPADSVERMLVVGREFKDTTCVPMVYTRVHETVDLLREKLNALDSVVFSGVYPYSLAHERLNIAIPAFYVPRDGTGLYRTLFQLSHHEKVDVTKLSFDTLSMHTIQETYRELKLDCSQVKCLEYRSGLSNEEMIKFHAELHRAGQVNAAVTCLHTPYLELKKLGIPIYRVLPTQSLIRQTLTYAQIKGEAKRMQGMQIAIMLLNLDNIHEDSLEYSAQRVRIKLQETILDYAEKLGAAMFSMGGAEYMLVTTRGAIEESTKSYTREPLLPLLRTSLHLCASVGVGLGETAIQAENRARMALQYARRAGGDCVFASIDGHVLLGPLDRTEQLEFRWRHEDDEITNHAEVTQLSATTLAKVRSCVYKQSGDTVTSRELAAGLKISERSARRLLAELHESKLAALVGEDQSSPRGRPRKVYRLKL